MYLRCNINNAKDCNQRRPLYFKYMHHVLYANNTLRQSSGLSLVLMPTPDSDDCDDRRKVRSEEKVGLAADDSHLNNKQEYCT